MREESLKFNKEDIPVTGVPLTSTDNMGLNRTDMQNSGIVNTQSMNQESNHNQS